MTAREKLLRLNATLHRVLVGDSSAPLPYSTDLNAAHQMEVELQRRGLEMAYQDELWTATDCHYSEAPGAMVVIGLWPIIHATAEQRCEAAIAVLCNSA